jgi:hypothetical protein
MPTQQNIPDDLVDLVLQLREVKRFQSSCYPPGLIQDTVYNHVFRCVSLAETLSPLYQEPDFPVDLNLLKRLLWLHDLVEIGLDADVLAPDKRQNPMLEAKTEKQEIATARRLLSSVDFKLWQTFETAKKVLQGDTHEEVIIEALIARIIDVLDGNITFNRSLVRYLASRATPTTFPDHALTYAFETNNTYQHALQHRPHWQSLSNLLVSERIYIQALWQAVTPSRIPPALKSHLNN